MDTMKNSKIAELLFLLILILDLLSGCSSGSWNNMNSTTESNQSRSTTKNTKIADDKGVYAQGKDDVENICVTIVTGNTVMFDDVNTWDVDSNYPKIEITIRFEYSKQAVDVSGD
jgi:hypothetical protein